MSRKYTIKEVQQEFWKFGYRLISSEYKNVHTKLKSVCPNGHTYNVSFTKWLAGRRCLCESGKNRLSIDIIKEKFESEKYILLSTEYKHGRKLEYICPEGHKHSIRWDHFRSGHRCPYCAGRPIVTKDDVKDSFAKEGYILLSDTYINSKQKLDYKCTNGHIHNITYVSWMAGYRCPECAPNMKKTLEFIGSDIKKEGYELITKNYENNHQKLHLICPNEHDYYVSWSNWKHQEARCPQCNDWGTSYQEKKLIDFIKEICKDVLEHDRQLISPYELDVVIPSRKVAIEYCGLYWHSELAGKDKNYHLNKLTLCEKKGYRLITIFEDELVFNKHIVFSRLRNFLHKETGQKIFARKCYIKEVSTADAKKFCNENHIQGYGSGAEIKLGLFYENSLVVLMTFSRPSIAKGSRNNDSTVWELHRFCSERDCRIVGGASKLLKYFEKNYKWSKIFSYADRRWSVGNVYEKLDFDFTNYIKPNYWYIKNQKRIHRFGLRKLYDDPKGFTEWEIRKAQGWNRIWDCGNIRYEKMKM